MQRVVVEFDYPDHPEEVASKACTDLKASGDIQIYEWCRCIALQYLVPRMLYLFHMPMKKSSLSLL